MKTLQAYKYFDESLFIFLQYKFDIAYQSHKSDKRWLQTEYKCDGKIIYIESYTDTLSGDSIKRELFTIGDKICNTLFTLKMTELNDTHT